MAQCKDVPDNKPLHKQFINKQDAMGVRYLSALILFSIKITRCHTLCLVPPGVHLPQCPTEIDLASALVDREWGTITEIAHQTICLSHSVTLVVCYCLSLVKEDNGFQN